MVVSRTCFRLENALMSPHNGSAMLSIMRHKTILSPIGKPTCTIGNGTQNVNMSYANNTLSAETANITINSNVLANLTIGTVTEVAKATGSNPTATASLIDTAGNQQTVTATVGNDSNPMQFINNGMTGADHTIKIGMSVADANIPGTYTYTVVLSCLQR